LTFSSNSAFGQEDELQRRHREVEASKRWETKVDETLAAIRMARPLADLGTIRTIVEEMVAEASHPQPDGERIASLAEQVRQEMDSATL
jgi:CxxC motif-containing protein (DUF1111 family)